MNKLLLLCDEHMKNTDETNEFLTERFDADSLIVMYDAINSLLFQTLDKIAKYEDDEKKRTLASNDTMMIMFESIKPFFVSHEWIEQQQHEHRNTSQKTKDKMLFDSSFYDSIVEYYKERIVDFFV